VSAGAVVAQEIASRTCSRRGRRGGGCPALGGRLRQPSCPAPS